MKLQFEENEYYLLKDGEELAIATTDESFIKELGAERLSVKNCQAIFNGYDLDELAEDYAEGNNNYHTAENSFIDGFQKALEILGDKKFSEEDLVSFGKRCFYKGFEKSENDDANCYTAFREEIGELIQSLQQTEFDVEIETIEYGLGNDENGRPVFETRNILDADGCLILKRK